MSRAPTLAATLGKIGDAALERTLVAVAGASAHVACALRTTMVQKVQTTNEFGDDVLTVDLVADKIICDRLKTTPEVASFSSEEHPELTRCASSGCFCVTFDPLDGSSIIDCNFSVGSIFGVWRGDTAVGAVIEEALEASVIVVYGPRTTLFVGHRSFGVLEFFLASVDPNAEDWRLVRSKPFTVADDTKFFSPGNLRAANDLPGYRKFLQEQVRNKKTLRYTGGMVPDVAQILVKGSGIFTTPMAAAHKVKLRVCFECGPIAHLLTCAGGAAWDGHRPYLQRRVVALDERSAIAVGSKNAVAGYIKWLQEHPELTQPPKAKAKL